LIITPPGAVFLSQAPVAVNVPRGPDGPQFMKFTACCGNNGAKSAFYAALQRKIEGPSGLAAVAENILCRLFRCRAGWCM
jgi:hypothetical protein